MKFVLLAILGLAIAGPCGYIVFWLLHKTAKDGRSSVTGGWLVFSAALAVLVAIIVPVWRAARPVAKNSACLNNLKQLALAQLQYSVDFDDRLPPADKWAETGAPYHRGEDVTRCPSATSPFSYAFNKSLSQTSLGDIKNAEAIVLLFEADATTLNAAGGPALILRTPRDQHFGVNMACADGRVRQYKDQAWTFSKAANK